MVLYNAVVAAQNAAAVGGNQLVQDPILRVGGQELAFYVSGRFGEAVLALSGQDVRFRLGRITPEQVRHHRPSYINALLIQSRGTLMVPACTRCQEGRGVFPECRRVQGHFGGCCGNCKWPDHAARCVWPRAPTETIVLSSDDDDDDDEQPVRRAGRALPATAGSGSAAQPIVVS